MATVEDKVFGSLEFEYVWSRYITVEFAGAEVEINLSISGEESAEFEEAQYASYTHFMKALKSLQPKMLQAILEYYRQRRSELGYETEANADYPPIETTAQLLEHITLVGLKIPYAGAPNSREVGVAFDCTWNAENGVGLRLLNEEIVEVGFQDIAL